MKHYKQEIKAVASTCIVVLFCVFSATMIVDMAVKLTKMPY